MDTRAQLQIDELTSEVNALRRRRDAATGRPYDVRLAQTCEVAGTPYPRFGAGPLLPIRFWQETRTRRVLDSPTQDAYCPVDWLPPETDVEVTLQPDGTYRMVRWPVELVGKVVAQYPSGTGISAAHWATSEEIDLDLGTGQLAVYRKSSAGIYSPQKYANDDPVLCTVWNPEGVIVSPTEVTTAILDLDALWIIQPPEVRSGVQWWGGASGSGGLPTLDTGGNEVIPVYAWYGLTGPDADAWHVGAGDNRVYYDGQPAWHRLTLHAVGRFSCTPVAGTDHSVIDSSVILQRYRSVLNDSWTAPLSWVLSRALGQTGSQPTAVEQTIQLQHGDSLRLWIDSISAWPWSAAGASIKLSGVLVIAQRLVQ